MNRNPMGPACLDPSQHPGAPHLYSPHRQPPPPPHQPQFYAGPPNYNMYCYPPSVNSWAGIPLISTVQRRSRKLAAVSRTRSFDEEKSFSTLALHAHGAPLILRYSRKPQQKKEAPRTDLASVQEPKTAETPPGSQGTGSETCLPRIIKPRKRRKKDRKPVLPVLEAPPEKPESEMSSSCSCRICDPAGKIWAFPLRRSCSDNSAEVEAETRQNVGVIGAGRTGPKNEWRSVPSLECAARKNSLSDSGDSGCDFLSGINLADDLFTDHRKTKTEDASLSRHLENLDLSSHTPAELSSSDSGSVFSDGGLPDLFVSFNNHLLGGTNISQLSSFLFSDSPLPPSPHLSTDLYNNNNNYKLMDLNRPQSDRPFVFEPEKDRGNESLSCIDMIWNWNGGVVDK